MAGQVGSFSGGNGLFGSESYPVHRRQPQRINAGNSCPCPSPEMFPLQLDRSQDCRLSTHCDPWLQPKPSEIFFAGARQWLDSGAGAGAPAATRVRGSSEHRWATTQRGKQLRRSAELSGTFGIERALQPRTWQLSAAPLHGAQGAECLKWSEWFSEWWAEWGGGGGLAKMVRRCTLSAFEPECTISYDCAPPTIENDRVIINDWRECFVKCYGKLDVIFRGQEDIEMTLLKVPCVPGLDSICLFRQTRVVS